MIEDRETLNQLENEDNMFETELINEDKKIKLT